MKQATILTSRLIMESFSLADLHSFELKFNSMAATVRPDRSDRIRSGRMAYKRHPKPPYSYTGLIAAAIQSSEAKKLTLADIHITLGQMFPFFRDARYTGWKDSVRHNLSHHDCFQMELKDPTRKNCKGNFWKVDMTKVSSDMLKRQQTNVAREGNWATDLHHQLGIPPLDCREAPTSPLSQSQCLPQSPTTYRKRKFEEDASMNYVKSEAPALKRHQPFTIANILREHQPVVNAEEDMKPLNSWVVPPATMSSWHKPLTSQSPDDSGFYGSISSASTSPGETISRDTLAKRHMAETIPHSHPLDLSLRDFQCPTSFNGLSTFDGFASPVANIPAISDTLDRHPTFKSESPVFPMTQAPSHFCTGEVQTGYPQVPQIADFYAPADDPWTNYYYFLNPAFVKQENNEFWCS